VVTQVIQTMKKAFDNTEATSQTASGVPSGKVGRIKHLFLWCFLAITLVVSGVAAGLLIELGCGPDWLAQIHPDKSATVQAALRWRMALSVVTIVAAAGGIFLFLNSRIAAPLEKTERITGQMVEGYLGGTLSSRPTNEIGRIGESINGLAVNFQEMLILVWNQTDNAINRLRRITGRMHPDGEQRVSGEMMAELQSAHQDLETMRMMVRSFDLYDVTIAEDNGLTAKGAAKTLN